MPVPLQLGSSLPQAGCQPQRQAPGGHGKQPHQGWTAWRGRGIESTWMLIEGSLSGRGHFDPKWKALQSPPQPSPLQCRLLLALARLGPAGGKDCSTAYTSLPEGKVPHAWRQGLFKSGSWTRHSLPELLLLDPLALLLIYCTYL